MEFVVERLDIAIVGGIHFLGLWAKTSEGIAVLSEHTLADAQFHHLLFPLFCVSLLGIEDIAQCHVAPHQSCQWLPTTDTAHSHGIHYRGGSPSSKLLRLAWLIGFLATSFYLSRQWWLHQFFLQSPDAVLCCLSQDVVHRWFGCIVLDELPNHQVFHPLCNVCVCQILATGFRQSVIFTSSNFLHHGIAPLASKKSQILHDVFVLPYLLVAHH